MSRNQISKGLWVGDIYTAFDADFVQKNNITLIVNCSKTIPFRFKNLKYIRIPVRDPGPGFEISHKDINVMTKCLPQVVDLIHNEIINGGNVLIHCRAGIQRSATVAVAFILKYYRKNNAYLLLKEAIQIVVAQRNVAFFSGRQVNFYESLKYFTKFHLGIS